MKCPSCNFAETKVIDSRLSGDGSSIRRRRECLKCERRFTTYEYVEHVPLMVVKRDGRRQPFDRKKIISGLVKACEKRPVSIDTMEELTLDIERSIQKKYEREVDSKVVGELIMEKLAALDEVAYVRFASVYRQFRDVNQFMSELKGMLEKEKNS
ncbi:MAG: transcriptional regulator NrdR [Omnitrophica WOR_2 bacterium GWF2_38_59]|nr:MAG: transcriptional regulator NrdR [Omnitrophica WOR_2 bacterium GWF2_38_59]OGX48553.1 MAG: transcriptional regulator NrdR [Omnitrophica WOR_2 bacterium RIFOXYA2_FULL_38_17]OGX58958.1 MAG: transcriptional regulator NrdR [Omnitrophica WOR_2 bacterium RIFOXYC2_FULL_38_12]OGX59325.1 MAG: transcriptional regulator NrdR [Omnitrophica WOR_2 bacterium RIFOXYB2_FULL_38_16]HBG62328.1 transcriptional regulator NrdR [Candidatus Omnitrophota bacterium]